ncbi:putative zinc-binding oxidoreductase ToxD [Talaromyces proteolyticus]|uniref:Zinc-binding oxidoreductase ToxD n=1 Tax=Talaromyces proteolyticus TaxID=1131652 RepID=A0AAD4KT56_9EURO|nr:putative zinc-binding oxidoreductase ToxD [Talaromyces proteolyticus]KAH8696390.1 putative zinc-binding oxidoreductase ToxD [Talaromyces proteolyticus]
MAISETNYGLIRKAAGVAAFEGIPVPTLPDDYLLIRVVIVAVNPTDWTTLDAPGDDGTLVGCDWAGTVEEIGPKVEKAFKIGDRVAGFAHGGNDARPQTGAFAKFIINKGDTVICVPDNVPWEAAASVPCAIGTMGLGLFKFLSIPFPGLESIQSSEASQDDNKTILIYGGSTATGTIAIQFAKLAGYTVITTASPKHFDLVKGRGADLVFDYNSPNVGEDIRKATDDKLIKVLDTVSKESSAKISAEALSSKGGTYVNLLGEYDAPRSDVESIFFLVYGITGEKYIFEGKHWEAQPTYFEFAKKFFPVVEKLWGEGKWTEHPREVRPGGLFGVLDGMKDMKEGKISGYKLLYRVEETQWPQ